MPVLELDDGTRLTEAAVILQYIADRNPGTLAPAFGTIERYRLMEWLNFIATELHKGFGPLWKPEHAGRVQERSSWTRSASASTSSRRCSPRSRTSPASASRIADAYLFTILNWAKILKVDLAALAVAWRSTSSASPRGRACSRRCARSTC